MNNFSCTTNIYSKRFPYGCSNTSSCWLPTTKELKKDVFFKGINKSFVMENAKSSKDVPEDANIFIFSRKSKLGLPEGREAKECILTEKGFSFLKKFFKSEDDNTLKLKNNKVDYVHGDFNDGACVCGVVDADNSEINQIENIAIVNLKNGTDVKLIDNVEELTVSDSKVDTANVKWVIKLNGNSEANKLKAHNLSVQPGNKVGEINSMFFTCKEDMNNPDKYAEIQTVLAEEGAEVSQSKINSLKTKQLMLKDSKINNLYAEDCMRFENSVIDNFETYNVREMRGAKINKMYLKGVEPVLSLHDKTQIENLTIKDSVAQIFVYPKKDWDKPVDNYIKKIKIESDFYDTPDQTPRLKIQGNIDVDEVVFAKKPGMVEMTKKENPSKHIKVINGYIKYNVPMQQPPQIEDIDV